MRVVGQCGVFALRPFWRGDLIAPYLGYRFTGKWKGCPHSTGVVADTGYLLSTKRNGFDASCHRSYAAMINHRSYKPNVRFLELGVRFVNKAVKYQRSHPDGAPVVLTPKQTSFGYPVRSVPLWAFSSKSSFTDGPGLCSGAVWIQATRRIFPGEELVVDYGPDAHEIITETRTRTSPPLVKR